MECPRRDEEDVVGAHGAVLGIDGRALDDGQNIPLHPLAGDIRSAAVVSSGDLVQLVEKYDSILLHVTHRVAGDFVHVDQLVGLLLFGMAVAGAVGFQVVLNEAVLSVHAKETQTALSIARAGLRFYMGDQIGVHEDTVTYSLDGGDAVVTARLVDKLRFNLTNRFGSKHHQSVYKGRHELPAPAFPVVRQIIEATLVLAVTNEGDAISLHRMNLAWSDTATPFAGIPTLALSTPRRSIRCNSRSFESIVGSIVVGLCRPSRSVSS